MNSDNDDWQREGYCVSENAANYTKIEYNQNKVVFISAPYKRGYKHTGGKGKEGTVRCGYCGKTVPRWKSFTSFRGFRITDPVLRKSIDSRQSSFFQTKVYACPGCARHRGIVKIGKSRKSR